MPDPRFFSVSGPFTLAQLAEIGRAHLHDAAEAGAVITDVAPIDAAGPDEVSFIDNPRYLESYKRSRAGAWWPSAGRSRESGCTS